MNFPVRELAWGQVPVRPARGVSWLTIFLEHAALVKVSIVMNRLKLWESAVRNAEVLGGRDVPLLT